MLARTCIVSKVSAGTDAMSISGSSTHILTVIDTHRCRFLVHHGAEVNALVGVRLIFLYIFRKGNDPTLDSAVVVNPHFRVLYLTALALLMSDLEEQMTQER